eukprot:4121447-Amphidinium_carterae.2
MRGAQWHAKRGMSLLAIKFIGRWPSDVVEAYVESAIEGQACLDAWVEKDVMRSAGKEDGDVCGGVLAVSQSSMVHAVLIGDVTMWLFV